MSVTSDVPKIQSEWLKLKKKPSADAYLPRESRDTMYVSRMECLKAAIDWNLKRLLVQYPHKKLVLILCTEYSRIIPNPLYVLSCLLDLTLA